MHIICQKPLCADLAEAESLVAELGSYPKSSPFTKTIPIGRGSATSWSCMAKAFSALQHLSLIQHDAKSRRSSLSAKRSAASCSNTACTWSICSGALLGEPRRVSASLQRVNPRVRGESLATALYDALRQRVIDISWKATGPELGSATLIGERGVAVYDGRMTRGKSRFRIYQEGQLVLDEPRSPDDDYCDSFYLLERDLTDAMLHGTPPPQPATENLKTLAATFAAYDAANAKRSAGL